MRSGPRWAAVAEDGPVVLDTMVFSALGIRGRPELRELYRGHVEGRRIVLSFQTVAEVRFGALNAGWQEQRRSELEQRISRAVVVPANDELTEVYASLQHRLRSRGHGLGDKVHDGDRWIASVALLHGLPLVSHDRIFLGVDGLNLTTEAATDD